MFFIVFSIWENVPVVIGPSTGRLHAVFMLTSDPPEISILGIFPSFFLYSCITTNVKSHLCEISYVFDLNLIKTDKVALSHAKQLSTVTVGVQWSNCDFEAVFLALKGIKSVKIASTNEK